MCEVCDHVADVTLIPQARARDASARALNNASFSSQFFPLGSIVTPRFVATVKSKKRDAQYLCDQEIRKLLGRSFHWSSAAALFLWNWCAFEFRPEHQDD